MGRGDEAVHRTPGTAGKKAEIPWVDKQEPSRAQRNVVTQSPSVSELLEESWRFSK